MIPGGLSMLMLGEGVGGTPPVDDSVYWSTINNAGPGITLSNSNRTAVLTPSYDLQGGMGAIGKSTGKHYFEIVCEDIHTMLGIATTAWISAGYGYGYTKDMWNGYYSFSGYVQGSQEVFGSNYPAGSVIGVALDLDNFTCDFYLNNVFQVQVASLTNTTWYPAYNLQNSGGATACTLNVLSTELVYTPPSGFVADMGTP